MRVAILGSGGIALGYAAFLAEAGHEAVLWSPSGRGTAGLAEGALLAEGAVSGRFAVAVVSDPARVVADADVVILAMRGNGHRAAIDAVAPHIAAGQTVIVSAQLSFGAAYLAERLAGRGVAAPVVAWATTALMGRRTGPASVTIGGIRTMLEIAVIPAADGAAALATCEGLFGPRFRLADSLLAIAVSNLNPPIHMASALCNLTRIEKGESWGNYDGITPAVARLIEGLDRERLAVAARCGLKVRTVEEHYQLTFGFPAGMSVAEMAAEVHRRRGGPPGPTSLDTRFVTEDMPFGILPVMRLAALTGVEAPLHAAGPVIFGGLYGRDFAADNDLLPAVSLPAYLPSSALALPG